MMSSVSSISQAATGSVKKYHSLPSDKQSPKPLRRNNFDGLIGLVNIGNSCYMNSALQALSNCPPFRQFLIECLTTQRNQNVSTALSLLFSKMWRSERNPGHLNPRQISATMRQRMFRGSQQQDAQEFIRCLLCQIHEEISIPLPAYYQEYHQGVIAKIDVSEIHHQDGGNRVRNASVVSVESLESQVSKSSLSSAGSFTKLVVNSSHSLTNEISSSLPVMKTKRSLSLPNSPSIKPKLSTKALYNQVTEGLQKGKIAYQAVANSTSDTTSKEDQKEKDLFPWCDNDIIVVDIVTSHASIEKRDNDSLENCDGVRERTKKCSQSRQTDRVKQKEKCSIITEIFQGELESRVNCLQCMKVSVTREPFQDLSLPIPGRKDMTTIRKQQHIPDHGSTSPEQSPQSLTSRMCRMWQYVYDWTHDVVTGPSTTLEDCMRAFFDTSDLSGDNRYFCEHCKSFQNSKKEMTIIKLPEVLCVHLKRFRYDAFFATKISRFIEFPLSDLDMSAFKKSNDRDSSECLYELMSVVTHFGGAGGGHYVAYAKNNQLNTWYEFNDSHVTSVSTDTVQNSEGYLLFYKRISPHPREQINIVDIIPPPGTTIPSDDVCYISRHWLLLKNSCCNPGPIIPYQYACQHGGILPGKEEAAKLLAVPIRKEVWDDLVRKYGGGPLVRSLDTCEICQNYLSDLKERRKKEKEDINQIQTSNKGKPETYLLSTIWLKQWQNFIHCDSLEVDPPGQVDNSTLLLCTTDQSIKLNTKSQYRHIVYEIWRYFLDVYGGGPTITTQPETIDI